MKYSPELQKNWFFIMKLSKSSIKRIQLFVRKAMIIWHENFFFKEMQEFRLPYHSLSSFNIQIWILLWRFLARCIRWFSKFFLTESFFYSSTKKQLFNFISSFLLIWKNALILKFCMLKWLFTLEFKTKI